jgi:archaellum component FlaC
MSSPGSNLERENSAKGGVVNHYLNSMMAPLKTLSIKEGMLLVEESKAPKTADTLEERLDALEEKTFRYNTVVERSLDAHQFINMELEKKVEEYKERIKDLEERYIYVISQLDKFQALVWDQENQNYEHEERFKNIAEDASLRYNDPPMSFYNGKPFSWKMEEWKADYEKNQPKEEK